MSRDSGSSSGDTEQKEEHRLGTIGQWDVPDADWSRSYDWTRYRGPDAYPVPGRWVLSMPDGDGTSWYYFEEGDGQSKSGDIEIDAEPLATALLFFRRDSEASIRDEPDVEWEFSIDGTEIFRRVNPDRDDAYGAIARALSAYHRGQDPDEIAATPDTGRKPDDVLEQEELERKQEENESLGRWSE